MSGYVSLPVLSNPSSGPPWGSDLQCEIPWFKPSCGELWVLLPASQPHLVLTCTVISERPYPQQFLQVVACGCSSAAASLLGRF